MGARESSEKGRSDDGCIGNRRVRTIVLSVVLIAFFCLSLPYIWANYESFAEYDDDNCYLSFWGQPDFCGYFATAYLVLFIAAFTCLGATVAALILFLLPTCEDKLGRIAGFVIIIGGLCYVAAWVWVIVLDRQVWGDTWEYFDDDTKEQLYSMYFARFGEALMAGGGALLLGLDACFLIYEKESHRLGSNLGMICAVSLCCFNSYYLQICGDDEASFSCQSGVAAVATGYLALFGATAVYLFLYICSCLTCNCKDNCFVRVLLAVALVGGGVLAAIGYYVYSGGYEQAEIDPDSDDMEGKRVAYFIGYTVLVAGLPMVWALDIAFNDIKRDSGKERDNEDQQLTAV